MKDVDVVVVGSGAAGLMAACTAAEEQAKVVVVTDRALGASNTAMAQGGIQWPQNTSRDRNRYEEDILQAAGNSDVDLKRIRALCENADQELRILAEWGLNLKRTNDGSYERTISGGMSSPRVVSSEGRVGPQVLKTLKRKVADLGIAVESYFAVTKVESEGNSFTVCSESREISSRAVVIATGGNTFKHALEQGEPSTNPPNDNSALHESLRNFSIPQIGAHDYQYHPLGILSNQNPRFGKCIPEKALYAGGVLRGKGNQKIEINGLDRRRLIDVLYAKTDLALTFLGAKKTFFLDIELVDEGIIPLNFQKFEVNYLGQRGFFVWPILHYQLGGFMTGVCGETVHPGLFMAGEVTGGVHGKCRLMGNGLTEAIVFGAASGRSAARFAKGYL